MGARAIGVKLMATNVTVKLNSNASLEQSNRSGPQVAMIATEVQLIAVHVVMKTAVNVMVYLCLFVQLKGFYRQMDRLSILEQHCGEVFTHLRIIR